ncbi:MAG: YeiH family protein [Caulobacteraceae bacterium]
MADLTATTLTRGVLAARAAVARTREFAPGLAATLAVAAAAWAIGAVLHAPAMLLALIFGMALNPVFATRSALAPGVKVSARTLLRWGIVLLGARVTLGELASLGLPTLLLAVGGVAITIAGGWAIGRALGLKSDHAALSAGAVAICGASAALAFAAVLPRREVSDRNTMITIIGVAALSTIAMVLYPLLAQALGIDHRAAGVFLGASIHDVAQVVGAGFMISPETAESATIVKLTRVVCLAPAVAVVALLFRAPREENASALQSPVPLFVLGFLAMMLIRSAGFIAEPFAAALTTLSQWLLLISVVALGANTSVKDILAPGPTPLIALTLQTLLIGAFALTGVLLLF